MRRGDALRAGCGRRLAGDRAGRHPQSLLGALLLMLRHHLRWQAAVAVGRPSADAGGQRGASRPRPVRWPAGDDDGPLAAALRHFLCRRPARRRLRAGRDLRRPGLRRLLGAGHRHDRAAIRLLSVPDADDGRRQRRVPDGRHLQPLRLVRGFPDRLVRPADPRLGTRADRRRDQIRQSSTCWRPRCSWSPPPISTAPSARSTWPTSRRRRPACAVPPR